MPSAAEPDQANLSVMDLYTIGIGPSSSHTVGPMRATWRFSEELLLDELLDRVARVEVSLYGSLALTGHGHHTDKACILGLSGERPRSVDPDNANAIVAAVRKDEMIHLAGQCYLPFHEETDLVFNYDELLPDHANGMRCKAFDQRGAVLLSRDYYSVGGGFVIEGKDGNVQGASTRGDNIRLKYPFSSGDELLEICNSEGLSISDVMLANEQAWREEDETFEFVDRVHKAMNDCIERGCKTEGILPGGLEVQRRAPDMFKNLMGHPEAAFQDPLVVLDWVNLFALAVNEENAAGSKVVTAPTNGAAGVIPAVLRYYERFCKGADQDGIRVFLITAAAIGVLFKKRASISAAEVGCQGEVGVACSMAAAGLTAALGGTPEQVENAAEIGMEHNLGLTCDPIAGLVQIPCIERNTMGAAKAINAARLSLRGDGSHKVSLDKVIETMRQTGLDMQSKYKETAQGGLAVNVVAC